MDLAPEKLSYTAEEAAAATGTSRSSIWRRIQAGDLKTFKWSGRTLIHKEDLQAALDRARRRSEAPPVEDSAAQRNSAPKPP